MHRTNQERKIPRSFLFTTFSRLFHTFWILQLFWTRLFPSHFFGQWLGFWLVFGFQGQFLKKNLDQKKEPYANSISVLSIHGLNMKLCMGAPLPIWQVSGFQIYLATSLALLFGASCKSFNDLLPRCWHPPTSPAHELKPALNTFLEQFSEIIVWYQSNRGNYCTFLAALLPYARFSQ